MFETSNSKHTSHDTLNFVFNLIIMEEQVLETVFTSNVKSIIIIKANITILIKARNQSALILSFAEIWTDMQASLLR